MKKTILLSVMVFLLLIWKGDTQFTEKFEPDISSDSPTFELLFLPNVFSFKATACSGVFCQERQSVYLNKGNDVIRRVFQSGLTPLGMLFLIK